MTPETINAVALGLFSLGLLLGAGSTLVRLVRLSQRGIPRPRLIWRDVSFVGGLGFTFVAILIHRVTGMPFVEEVWWALFTATVAVASVWVYAYFEFFVIGHRRDGPPTITEHSDGHATIETHGPATITVEPESDE